MLSGSTPGMRLQKDKPKIMVIGDSFARGIAGELVHNVGSNFEAIGHVKPGSGIKKIIDSANQDVSTLTKKDVVVVLGATNDIAKNEAKTALTQISKFVELRKHTNVRLVDVSTRFDLSPTPTPGSSAHNNKCTAPMTANCWLFTKLSDISATRLKRVTSQFTQITNPLPLLSSKKGTSVPHDNFVT